MVKRAGAVLCLVTLAACGDDGGFSVTGPTAVQGSRRVVNATGSEAIRTEERPVRGFSAIAIDLPGRAHIEPGGRESLTITAPEKALPVIVSEIVGGQLRLRVEDDTDLRLDDAEAIVIRVTYRELKGIELRGIVRAEAEELATDRLAVRVEGVSSLEVRGKAGHQEVIVSGTSRYQAGGLESETARIEASGAAFALLDVRRRLSGQVSGAAVVEFLGNPELEVSVDGAGAIRPR